MNKYFKLIKFSYLVPTLPEYLTGYWPPGVIDLRP